MTPRKAFDDQQRHASARGIPWEFTYEEWLEMWLVSGKWQQRGKKSGQYCMCRYFDVGPYSAKNCYIALTEENQQTRWESSRKVLKEDHQEMVRMWLDTGLTQREVAKHFGVHQSQVSKLIKKVKEAANGQ